ncbi:MAG: protein-export chaperone SecB [Pseudomonadota bacterium]
MSMISIRLFKVESLKFDEIDDPPEGEIQVTPDEESEEAGNTYRLRFSAGFNEDDRSSFAIRFACEVASKDEFKLELEYLAIFEVDEPYDDDFMSGPFVRVNAPAIAYPYLRAFVSNLTLNCGYEANYLPTVNFQVLYNEELAADRTTD